MVFCFVSLFIITILISLIFSFFQISFVICQISSILNGSSYTMCPSHLYPHDLVISKQQFIVLNRCTIIKKLSELRLFFIDHLTIVLARNTEFFTFLDLSFYFYIKLNILSPNYITDWVLVSDIPNVFHLVSLKWSYVKKPNQHTSWTNT